MEMSSFFYQVLQLMEHQWNETDREKPTTRRKTCTSATLSTTNLTWNDPGSNPGLCGERPVTNRLSHGTVLTLLSCRKPQLNVELKLLLYHTYKLLVPELISFYCFALKINACMDKTHAVLREWIILY
jgi:hypothetical protein